MGWKGHSLSLPFLIKFNIVILGHLPVPFLLQQISYYSMDPFASYFFIEP